MIGTYNRLVYCVHSQDFNKSLMCVFHFGINVTVIGFLSVFVCWRAPQLAFKTTSIVDTHLTLAVISFRVGVNNHLFFCRYKHTRRFLPSFCSCRINNFSVLITLLLELFLILLRVASRQLVFFWFLCICHQIKVI